MDPKKNDDIASNTGVPTTMTSSGNTKIPLIHLPRWNENDEHDEHDEHDDDDDDDEGGKKDDDHDHDHEHAVCGSSTIRIDMAATPPMAAECSRQLVDALQTSGFLLVQSPDLSLELQRSALQAASQVLIGSNASTTNSRTNEGGVFSAPSSSSSDNNNGGGGGGGGGVEGVIDHPTDPKLYLMLDSVEDIATKCNKKSRTTSSDDEQPAPSSEEAIVIQKYWEAVERVKRQVLTCLAVGLNLAPDYFVKMHSQNKSALRLLHYPTPPLPSSPTSSTTVSTKQRGDDGGEPTKPKQQGGDGEPVIRCKPHSDYGSITILLTDGVPGLEAFIEDQWTPVPYVEGALVVNIGSLLQDWTNGKLLATLHRVVAVVNDAAPSLPRTSLAFFADPDPEVSATLQDPAGMVPPASMYKSVADYIQWRSGGKGRQRSGLAFSKDEEERLKRARTTNSI